MANQVVEDVTGAGALLSSVAMNLAEIMTGNHFNGWIVLATSLGGLIWLYWRIATQKKAKRNEDLREEKLLLEIQKLKDEQKTARDESNSKQG